MVQDLNAISTASIPVIKAIVDLNELRDSEMSQISPSPLQDDSQDFGLTQANMSIEERKQQQE
jgi:DNA polymerase sigma